MENAKYTHLIGRWYDLLNTADYELLSQGLAAGVLRMDWHTIRWAQG